MERSHRPDSPQMVTVQVWKRERDTFADHLAVAGGELGMKGWPMISW
jgi:hypothetical protein